MTLRVVGAGLGRTGTMSLKLAFERLLGAPCYHMVEVMGNPEHVPIWHGAVTGRTPDWQKLFAGYAAAVDWPASAFWKELSEVYPDAIILLSVRDSESWWRSADQTIFRLHRGDSPLGAGPSGPSAPPEFEGRRAMIKALFEQRFTSQLGDRSAAIAAYERHNDDVRRNAPASRLVEWRPGDGWAPLCAALGLPVPDEPFPHVNTTEEFNARVQALVNAAAPQE